MGKPQLRNRLVVKVDGEVRDAHIPFLHVVFQKVVEKKGSTFIELLIDLTIIITFSLVVLLIFGRGAFISETTAVRALEKQGYSDIRITDHSWVLVGLRGCDRCDAAKFTAEVTNPAGNKAEVFVCTGWLFKGATIRTD